MGQLELRQLTKRYSNRSAAAVENLNLTINQGELMVLLGPSGCGKTTTLRLIAGLIEPSAGEIFLNGRSVLKMPPERRDAVMVFQDDALFPFMTVGENVAFGLKMRRVNRHEAGKRVVEALAAVQLKGWESRWPTQLSGGQKQRVALARALVVRPQILLLDEPLTHLDRPLRRELREMVCRLQRDFNITTLFVTHDQAEAFSLADRIGIMFDGRLRQTGSPRHLYERPADLDVARFLGDCNILPGVKTGRTVTTAIGRLEIAPLPINDGAVLITVRPEAIQIGSNGHNNFTARIDSVNDKVPTAECWVKIGEVPLCLTPAPHAELSANQQITVHLPSDRLGVMPAPTQ